MRVRVLLSVAACVVAAVLPQGPAAADEPDGSCGQSRYAVPRLSLHAPQPPRSDDHTLIVAGTLTLDRCGLGGHTVSIYGRTRPGEPFRWLAGASGTTYSGPDNEYGTRGEWSVAIGGVYAAADLVAVSSAKGSVPKAYSQVVHRSLRVEPGTFLGGCLPGRPLRAGDALPPGVTLSLRLPDSGRARQTVRGQVAVRNDSANAVAFEVMLLGGDASVRLQSRVSGEVPVGGHFSDEVHARRVTLQQGEEVLLPARLVLRSCQGQGPHPGPTLRPDTFDATAELDVFMDNRFVRWVTPPVTFTVPQA